MRLRRTYFFFNLPESAITHSINQYELVPFELLLKTPKNLLTNMGKVRNFLANEPLNDVTKERVRFEEFEESLCKDCG